MNTSQEFRHELHALLVKHNVEIEIDLDGDTYGINNVQVKLVQNGQDIGKVNGYGLSARDLSELSRDLAFNEYCRENGTKTDRYWTTYIDDVQWFEHMDTHKRVRFVDILSNVTVIEQ